MPSKDMLTPDELRARALSAFEAEVVSLGRVVDETVKLAKRTVDALKKEAFDGVGYKGDGVPEGWLDKFQQAVRIVSAAVDADARYHKSAKERSKRMTREETKAVIRTFLFGELDSKERAEFIKALALEHAQRFQTPTGANITTSNQLKALDAVEAAEVAP